MKLAEKLFYSRQNLHNLSANFNQTLSFDHVRLRQ